MNIQVSPNGGEPGEDLSKMVKPLEEVFRVTPDPRLHKSNNLQSHEPKQSPKEQARRSDSQPTTQQKREEYPKERSVKDSLLARAQAADLARNIFDAVDGADESIATPKIVKLLADFVRGATAIGTARLRFAHDLAPKEAREQWFSLSLEEWEEALRHWAEEGDSGAKEVVKIFGDLARNTLLLDLVRRVIQEFYRPCVDILTYEYLVSFLEALVEKGLANVSANPRYAEEEIILRMKGRDLCYFPARDIPLSRLGWPFVKEAEERVKQNVKDRTAKVEALRIKATPDLTPLKVSAGQEGLLFLYLGGDSGILIEAKKQNGEMLARVVEARGIYIASLPSNWVKWSPDTNYVPSGEQWPSWKIPSSLKAWERRISQAEEKGQLIASLKSMATLPIPFEDKGLTLLLKEEATGVVAMWIRDFRWGGTEGLFGLAIERRESEKFLRLCKVISTHAFPEELQGKEIPPLQVVTLEDGSIRAIFGQLPQMEREKFNGLKMVEKAIQMRLKAEFRSSQGEPAPEKDNN